MESSNITADITTADVEIIAPDPEGRCGNGTCHEHRVLPNGQVEVWSSRFGRDNGVATFDPDEFLRHLQSAKAGDLDGLIKRLEASVRTMATA